MEERTPRSRDETRRLIDEMSEGARSFWERESAETAELATEAITLEGALGIIDGPVVGQKTIDQALRTSDQIRRATLTAQARRGGQVGKTDALQTFIEDLVARNRSVTPPEVLERLMDSRDGGFIEDIEDGRIHFQTGSGQSKSASISGLKDRLSRARKKIASR